MTLIFLDEWRRRRGLSLRVHRGGDVHDALNATYQFDGRAWRKCDPNSDVDNRQITLFGWLTEHSWRQPGVAQSSYDGPAIERNVDDLVSVDLSYVGTVNNSQLLVWIGNGV